MSVKKSIGRIYSLIFCRHKYLTINDELMWERVGTCIKCGNKKELHKILKIKKEDI